MSGESWPLRRSSRPGLEHLVAATAAVVIFLPGLALAQAPVAVDDLYEVPAGEPFIVDPRGVLENDTDAQGEDLPPTAVAELVSDVSNGTLDLAPDGSFTYDADPGFLDIDTFVYRVMSDGQYSNQATVTLDVCGCIGTVPLFYCWIESEFVERLQEFGLFTVQEGFEDDEAWGPARRPLTSPSITSQGTVWEPNTSFGGVSTGPGPARTGQYGFFQIPHGDLLNGIRDGWFMTGTQTLYGVGGWIYSTTPSAKIRFILDGVPTGESYFVGGDHRFVGVIDTDGFTVCEINETEAVDEMILLFADDFTFGVDTQVDVSGSSVSETPTRILPNAPNPFQRSTMVRFDIREPAPVTVRIYDSAGRLVRQLLHRELRGPGGQQIQWNGIDDAGNPVAPGVYLSVIDVGGERSIGKMTLTR